MQPKTLPVLQAIKNTPSHKLLEALPDNVESGKAIRHLCESKEYNIA
jgi:hypothetical protein